MTTYFLELDFRKPDPKFPGPPQAQIYVKSNYKDENFDHLIISSRCVSFSEFEHQIKRLQDELKAIRKKAKIKFENLKK